MYVCSCFGITEQQVRDHADTGACTPRQIASACKAGTDCGGCVRRIQALLGRGACPRRELIDKGAPEPLGADVPPVAAEVPPVAAEPLPVLPDAPVAEPAAALLPVVQVSPAYREAA
ncbi:(2Fe-2S)-binding protein [Streptomyces catenulae]|uniref:Bacterioferritin-associated ferredoxin n=1 Tax=Streptomyces catenulae TaxID=66875 RepID=A0ABV2Z8F2_9ACTN|nr:(2Fe-2S)-binding protein [Streptomyces catenulae]